MPCKVNLLHSQKNLLVPSYFDSVCVVMVHSNVLLNVCLLNMSHLFIQVMNYIPELPAIYQQTSLEL